MHISISEKKSDLCYQLPSCDRSPVKWEFPLEKGDFYVFRASPVSADSKNNQLNIIFVKKAYFGVAYFTIFHKQRRSAYQA